MASCGFVASIKSGCDDFTVSGGNKRTLWLFNLDDLDRTQGNGGYTLDSEGNVVTLIFKAGKGLYEFETKKNVVSSGFEMVKGEGTNVFNHNLAMKIFKRTGSARETLKDLSVSEVGAIVESNSRDFEILGLDSGMEVTAMSQNSGTTQQSDNSVMVTFQGADDDLPRFLKVTGNSYGDNLGYIESLVQG